MKKTLSVLTILAILILSACDASDTPYASIPTPPQRSASIMYYTFEEALQKFATDVVIVQYVGSRPFGRRLTEFEFVVLERVLGSAADRIFVYVDKNFNARLYGGPLRVNNSPRALIFNPGTTYMLPLSKINHPLAYTHEDGFRFIINTVIDLDNPANSRRSDGPLHLHSTSLDFSRSISGQEIMSFVEELTRHNPPARDIIKSEAIEDIINESPYIFIVEVNEPLRLSNEQGTTDWWSTDLYYITVIQDIKGTIGAVQPSLVIFPADVVLPGERHIVAVEPIEEGSTWFRVTSRNSLFRMDQLDEILAIIGTTMPMEDNIVPDIIREQIEENANALSQAPIDLRPLLWQDFDEIQHLFGNITNSEPCFVHDFLCFFDTGLSFGLVATDNDTRSIRSIFIDYGLAYNLSAFHFSGIDGTSTYDDVVTLFGNPFYTRSGSDEVRIGAVEAYGYWVEEHGFAWIAFYETGYVASILFFCVRVLKRILANALLLGNLLVNLNAHYC